tara:strand:+ start:224 stop:838 length:615 start_codon:yes stop_codon:yes gene_type:complete
MSSTILRDFQPWLDWQMLNGNDEFYDKHSGVEQFIKNTPMVKFPLDKKIHHIESMKYCFGDFYNFIILDNNCNIDLKSYCSILITLYDMNKGYKRFFLGDPKIISLLRNYIKYDDLKSLINHITNFLEFTIYPYEIIHGHTAAYFSLSTMISCLISHFLYKFHNVSCPRIEVTKAENAMRKKLFKGNNDLDDSLKIPNSYHNIY